jgi:hypothetical protein
VCIYIRVCIYIYIYIYIYIWQAIKSAYYLTSRVFQSEESLEGTQENYTQVLQDGVEQERDFSECAFSFP